MKNVVNLLNCLVWLENRKCPTTFEKAEAFTEMFAQTSLREGLSKTCRNYTKTMNIMLMLQVHARN